MNNRISLVHYSSAPGGIEVLMPGIIRMLPDKEFFVFVIRPPVKEENNVYENTSVKVKHINSGGLPEKTRPQYFMDLIWDLFSFL